MYVIRHQYIGVNGSTITIDIREKRPLVERIVIR
jgi:hypothetical protein